MYTLMLLHVPRVLNVHELSRYIRNIGGIC